MLRRTFMKFMGLVPTIVPVQAGIMRVGDETFLPDPVRNVHSAMIFTYGRVGYTSREIHNMNRAAWEQHVECELKALKVDYMKQYDRMVAGQAPVSWNANTQTGRYINELL